MDDAELVRRAAAGDRDAWAAIYDRYADRLHDYAWTILRNRQDAEDALQDTFVSAASKIGQLRDPSALRPWLYAICRNQALGRTRARARELPTDEVPEVIEPASARDELDVEELRTLVWAAAGGLAPRERAILDLHLRQGLDGAELGAALEVSPHNATVMLSRVRTNVDRSLGALLVARTGRGECAELDALLVGWDGTMNPLLRKRVARHIDRCEICGERRKRMVAPSVLLSGVPILPAPLYLRDRILDDAVAVSSGSPAPSGRVGRIRRTGASRRRGGLWWGAGAASVALVLGTVLLFSGEDSSSSTVTTAPAPTASDEASGESSDADSPTGSSSSSESPSGLAPAAPGSDDPSLAGPGSPTSTPGQVPGAPTPTATANPSVVAPPLPPPPQQPPQPPPPPPPAPPGALEYAGGTLAFGTQASTLTTSFRNTGGQPVSWSVSSPVGWVSVSPASGSLPAGGVASVTVTLDRASAPEGSLNAALTLSGSPAGPISIPFSATVDRPPAIGSLSANRAFVSFDPQCVTTARAQVSDPALQSVTLNWQFTQGGGGSVAMSEQRGFFVASFPAAPAGTIGTALDWWVVATDAGGTSSRADGNRLSIARGCP